MKHTGHRDRKQKKRERILTVYKQRAIAAAVFAAALLVIYCLIAGSYRTKFMRGTYINGMNVSGKNAEETEDLLEKSVESYALQLTFRGGQRQKLTSDDVGFTYHSSGEAAVLLEKQKRMSWLAHLFGKKSRYTVSTSYTFDEDKLKKSLLELPEFKSENVTSPVDAKMVLKDDREFVIEPEEEGNELDEDTVTELVSDAVRREKKDLNLDHMDGAYREPSVRQDDQDLVSRVENLNTFISCSYSITGKDKAVVRIGRKKLISWLSQEDDGSYAIDSGKVADRVWTLVQKLADKYDKVKTTLKFKTTCHGTETFDCDPYGYKIDVDETAEPICNAIVGMRSEDFTLKNSVEEKVDATFGGLYVEVDIPNQHVYLYKSGKIFYETDCVTGLESDPDRLTPSGVFAIYSKEENKTLEGRLTADGPATYTSDVSYWMPFYESYGMHDAPWRDKFGGQIYKEAGSHGCVNLPEEAAETIYNNTEVGTAVIVVR